jgi:putative phosphonate metabolism protein
VSGDNMGDWRRHAIYFAPPSGSDLARFGAAWLGWDPEAAAEVPRLHLDGIAPEAVTDPARYGFHATLKAPFGLADGATVTGLDAAAAELARALPGFDLRLEVATVGGFVALVPVAAPPALARLEAALVCGLDRFRAPLTAAEIARRRPDRLDPVERACLDAWGYPFVLDRFRFHMTLTGPLDRPAAEGAQRALAGRMAPILADPVVVREICRFSESPDGRFHLTRRFPLAAVA